MLYQCLMAVSSIGWLKPPSTSTMSAHMYWVVKNEIFQFIA